MKMTTEYTASLKAADLATIAKATKNVHPEITMALSDDGISFWAKDDRKEVAVVGSLALAKAVGQLAIRTKAEQVAGIVKSLPNKADVALRVLADGDVLALAVEAAGISRTADVTEAEESDQPYQPEFKSVASCIVDLEAFAQVLTSFKRAADVMTVEIASDRFLASYKTRDGSDQWNASSDNKGQGKARFSIALLLAAVKACKTVGKLGRIQLSKDGPMRILVKGENVKLTAFVVSSKAL